MRDPEAARDVVGDDDARDAEALAHLDQVVDEAAGERIETARGLRARSRQIQGAIPRAARAPPSRDSTFVDEPAFA